MYQLFWDRFAMDPQRIASYERKLPGRPFPDKKRFTIVPYDIRTTDPEDIESMVLISHIKSVEKHLHSLDQNLIEAQDVLEEIRNSVSPTVALQSEFYQSILCLLYFYEEQSTIRYFLSSSLDLLRVRNLAGIDEIRRRLEAWLKSAKEHYGVTDNMTL